MANQFVFVNGLHNVFNVSTNTSQFDYSNIKSEVSSIADSSSIMFMEANGGDTPQGFVAGEHHIWADGKLFKGTDDKVTSATNHYTPTTSSTLTATASGGTAAWGVDVIKSISISKDSKGHITGLSVTSGKLPAAPETGNNISNGSYITVDDGVGNTKIINASTASLDDIAAREENEDYDGLATARDVYNKLTDAEYTIAETFNILNGNIGFDENCEANWSVNELQGMTLIEAIEYVKNNAGVRDDEEPGGTKFNLVVSSTPSSTAAKAGTAPGFILENNQAILFQLVNNNTASSNVTLNINGTGAKPVKIGSLNANSVNFVAGYYVGIYDGTNWKLTKVEWTDEKTTKNGHYTPTDEYSFFGSSGSIGISAGIGLSIISGISTDSKKHVTAIQSGQIKTTYKKEDIANGDANTLARAKDVADYINDYFLNAGVQYLGTINSSANLIKTDVSVGKGDFYRVSSSFSISGETAHVGDIVLSINDKPTTNSSTDWSIIHTEVDSNTWVANTKTADGYVTKGTGQLCKVWKTDLNGNPGWRDDFYRQIKINGTLLLSSSSLPPFDISAGSNITLTPAPREDGKVIISSSDTKVTSAENHYTPSTKTTSGNSSGSVTWGGTIVTGASFDSKGHNTGLYTASLPANPNTDNKVAQVTPTSTNLDKWRPVLSANVTNGTELGDDSATSTSSVYKANTVKMNLNTGVVKAVGYKSGLSTLSEGCTMQYDFIEKCMKFVFEQ